MSALRYAVDTTAQSLPRRSTPNPSSIVSQSALPILLLHSPKTAPKAALRYAFPFGFRMRLISFTADSRYLGAMEHNMSQARTKYTDQSSMKLRSEADVACASMLWEP